MLAETLTKQLIVKMYKIGDVLNKHRDLTMEISTKKIKSSTQILYMTYEKMLKAEMRKSFNC